MIYLPDTNVWIRYLTRRSESIIDHIRSLRTDEIALCSVVLSELYYGAYKGSRRARNLELIEGLVSRFASFGFTNAEAQEAGRIRAHLAEQGTPIGPYDLQIAATAMANGLTVVTHNVSEFRRVPELTIEDWESEG